MLAREQIIWVDDVTRYGESRVYLFGLSRTTHSLRVKVHHSGDSKTVPAIRKAYQTLVDSGLALPVGVQVVGRPYTDEMVLRVMRELEGLSEFDGQDFTWA